MNEKEMYLNRWAAEYATTLNILNAYPTSHSELKPGEKSKTGRELAWMFVLEQKILIAGAASGKLDFSGASPAPATFPEVVKSYEAEYKVSVPKVNAMSETDWNDVIDWPVGPKQMGKVRRGDILWMGLNDMIHHRGQLSVYIRIAGGKLPSIYGPTADEPWN